MAKCEVLLFYAHECEVLFWSFWSFSTCNVVFFLLMGYIQGQPHRCWDMGPFVTTGAMTRSSQVWPK